MHFYAAEKTCSSFQIGRKTAAIFHFRMLSKRAKSAAILKDCRRMELYMSYNVKNCVNFASLNEFMSQSIMDSSTGQQELMTYLKYTKLWEKSKME